MTVLAAALVGLALAMVAAAIVPPPVRVGRRIAPYVQTHRRRSGLTSDVAVAVDPGFGPQTGPVTSIIRSLATGFNRLVGEVIDIGDDAELRLRLRRAGVEPPTPGAYRAQQLTTSFIGAGCGLGIAVLLGWRAGNVKVSVLMLVTGIGFLVGVISYKAILERKALQRRKEMQLSLYTVTQVLAVLARANRGPIGAVRHLASRGRGPLVDELRIGIGWMERGSSAELAFEQLGRDAPDPSTARLFRLIATATSSGGNIARTLRAQADQLRKEHTEHMEQLATKKRSAMVLPSIVVMVPVLLLYALAPGPGMIFGGSLG
jgi:Flp pilus assembly protein TadB